MRGETKMIITHDQMCEMVEYYLHNELLRDSHADPVSRVEAIVGQFGSDDKFEITLRERPEREASAIATQDLLVG